MDDYEKKINKQIEHMTDSLEDMSEKDALKAKDIFEKEIKRMIASSILDVSIIYALTGLSFAYLYITTSFALFSYVISILLPLGFLGYRHNAVRKQRKEDYQELLRLCKVPEKR